MSFFMIRDGLGFAYLLCLLSLSSLHNDITGVDNYLNLKRPSPGQ
jgi:hypothetical protein